MSTVDPGSQLLVLEVAFEAVPPASVGAWLLLAGDADREPGPIVGDGFLLAGFLDGWRLVRLGPFLAHLPFLGALGLCAARSAAVMQAEEQYRRFRLGV